MVFALYMGHIICPINMITLFVARDEKYESKKSASSSTHMILALYMEDGPLCRAAPSENSSLWIKNLKVNGPQSFV